MKKTKIATILSFIIGIMAVFIGVRVAFLGQKMPYYVIGWLPVYNLVLGLIAVFISTILIWKNSRFALPISIATLVSHSAVTLFLLIGYMGTVSVFSLVAMFIRIATWVIILKLLLLQKTEAYPMKEEYDASAKYYDPLLYLAINPIRLEVMKELSQHKDSAILDLCCGTGNQLKLLSKNGFENLHGLDLSKAMLEVARKGDHSIKIYNKDATETNFDDATFDIVMLSFAIHEKDRETQEKMLDEAHRILKKDGKILIVDFSLDEKTTKLGKFGIDFIERMAGEEHYRNFKKYIADNGLESLIKADKFALIKDSRKAFNGVTISTYKKA